MRFKYLSEVGHHFSSEEGTPGKRTKHSVWEGIEKNLKQAIVDLKNLLATSAAPAAVPTGGKSVKDLIRFHEAAARKHAPQAAIEAARRKVDFFRKWLAAEGAVADADGNIDMKKLQNLVVVYDHDLQKRGMTRVTIHGGRLFTDSACQKPLDTSNMVTHFSGPGKGIYVLSYNGNIHVASHVVGHYHHSSLLAGSWVACAGELAAIGGSVVWLSNKSGHYQPGIQHLLQMLHLLQKKGVPLTFRLTVLSASGQKQYNTVGEFMKELELNDEPDYELYKLLAYAKHLKPDVLQRNNWRWREDPAREAPGVYEISTGRPVPHKTVRQWLKSQNLFGTMDVQSGKGR